MLIYLLTLFHFWVFRETPGNFLLLILYFHFKACDLAIIFHQILIILRCSVVSWFFRLLMSQSLPGAHSQNSLNMLSWFNTIFVFHQQQKTKWQHHMNNVNTRPSGFIWQPLICDLWPLRCSVRFSPAISCQVSVPHDPPCFLLTVCCRQWRSLQLRWKEDDGAFKHCRLRGGEGCGLFSWNGAEGRGQCTWPPSGLEFQRSVQSGFLTFGGFTPEFCRRRFRTDVYRLKPWEIKHINISCSYLKGHSNAKQARCLRLTGGVLNKRNRWDESALHQSVMTSNSKCYDSKLEENPLLIILYLVW